MRVEEVERVEGREAAREGRLCGEVRVSSSRTGRREAQREGRTGRGSLRTSADARSSRIPSSHLPCSPSSSTCACHGCIVATHSVCSIAPAVLIGAPAAVVVAVRTRSGGFGVELETVRRRATVGGLAGVDLSSAASDEAASETGGEADEGGTDTLCTCASVSSAWTASVGAVEEEGEGAAEGDRSETT